MLIFDFDSGGVGGASEKRKKEKDAWMYGWLAVGDIYRQNFPSRYRRPAKFRGTLLDERRIVQKEEILGLDLDLSGPVRSGHKIKFKKRKGKKKKKGVYLQP